MAGADVQVASAVHVPNDVAEDAVTGAITDVQGVHTSPETIIAYIIEDVLEGEGNRWSDSQLMST